MYNDPGPSRSGASYTPDRGPYGGNVPAPRGPGSVRREGEYEERGRDERNGYGRDTPTNTRPYGSSPWSRPPPRSDTFRPYSTPGGASRSRTPSPSRRLHENDRDRSWEPPPRSRGNFETRRPGTDGPRRTSGGSFPGPSRDNRERPLSRERDRDTRWGNRRDDRFRDDSRIGLGPNRRSPDKGSISRFSDRPIHSPPRAPRPLISQGSTSHPGSRIPSDSWRDNRNDYDRREGSVPGPGPSTMAYARQTSTPAIPRGPRSSRGASSPVEFKHNRDDFTTPNTVPLQSVPLPEEEVKTELFDADLEEGEVLSPVKAPRERLPNHEPPRYRERERDRGWQTSPVRRTGSYDKITTRGRNSYSPQERDFNRSGPPATPPLVTGRNPDDGSATRQRGRSASSPRDRKRAFSAGGVERYRPPETPQRGVVVALDYGQPTPQRSARPPTPPLSPLGPISNTFITTTQSVEDHDMHGSISRPATPAFPPPTQPSSAITTKIASEMLAAPEVPTRGDTPVMPPSITSVNAPFAVEEPQYRSASPHGPPQDRPPTPVYPPGHVKQEIVEIPVVKSTPLDLLPGDELVPISIDQVPPEAQPFISSLEVAIVPDLTNHLTETAPMVPVETPSVISEVILATTPTDGIKLDVAPATGTSVGLDLDSSAAVPLPVGSSEPAVMAKADRSILDKLDTLLNTAPAASVNSESVNGRANISPTVRRVTIAERRAVHLPPAAEGLSSPFGNRLPRQDPMPTADSLQESTDAETEVGPKTADLEDAQSDTSDEVREETKQSRIIAAIKTMQVKPVTFDYDGIVAWNQTAAPVRSSRSGLEEDPPQRTKRLRDTTWPLIRSQKAAADRVAITILRETAQYDAKLYRLHTEYKDLDEEWKEQCLDLDHLMEKRGPPPKDLYATPFAIPTLLPGVGPVPTTPLDEMSATGMRGNRRRGGGDSVNTDAELQEILDFLEADANKDPTLRASKTTAVVPDMLLGEERRLHYEDENDLVTDPLAFYDFKGRNEPIWNDEERAMFLRRYLAYPKQFGRVADGLPNKSASDCVLYYYRTKREVDYKGMLASKRGDKKRRVPIKNTGKGSALLADLDRKKPTVVTTPARGVRDEPMSTTAKKGRGPRSEILPITPGGGEIPRRKQFYGEEDDTSASTSQAGSEAPVGKSKLRMTIKGPKRPRVSSSGIDPNGIHSTVYSGAQTEQTELAAGGEPLLSTTPIQPELLPPVKRAGKRRKVVPGEPPLLEPMTDTPSTADKPARRAATNSYWSVEEKRRFKELLSVHGTDFRVIAILMKTNKSERQVANFYDSNKEGMELEAVVVGAGDDDGRMANSTRSKSPAYRPSNPYGRSIYDVYPGQATSEPFDRRYTNEPRLGMFPPHNGTTLPPLTNLPHNLADSPVKPISRPGGMRISALLNDDAAAEPIPRTQSGEHIINDATSDGTVSERDVDITSPSRQIYPQPRRISSSIERPDLDRFRSAPALARPYTSTAWSPSDPNPNPHPNGSYFPAPAPVPRASSANPAPTLSHPHTHSARSPWEYPRPIETFHHHPYSTPRWEESRWNGNGNGNGSYRTPLTPGYSPAGLPPPPQSHRPFDTTREG